MNTLPVYYILQFVGTSMLIIGAPSNMFLQMFGLSLVLVKSSRRIHPIILDFPFAGRRLSCCDREKEDEPSIHD